MTLPSRLKSPHFSSLWCGFMTGLCVYETDTKNTLCVFLLPVRSKPLCQFVKLFPAIFFFLSRLPLEYFFKCILYVFIWFLRYREFEFQIQLTLEGIKKKHGTQTQTKKRQESINLADVSRYLRPFALPWLPCSLPPLSFDLFSPSIYYPTISLQQNKKELKTTPTAPVSVWSNHLATFFSPCFNVLHILSWSLLFIHRFIPLNPPSPSVLLIFLSPCLSHFIRLLQHFPLPSIIMIPRLFRILISPSPICEIDISGLVLFPHRRPRRGLAVLTLKVFNWSSLQHSFWLPHWSEAFFH